MKTREQILTQLGLSLTMQKLLSKQGPELVERAYRLGQQEVLESLDEKGEKFTKIIDKLYHNWAPENEIVLYRADAESLLRFVLKELKEKT